MATKTFAVKELDIVLQSYRKTLTQLMDEMEKGMEDMGISMSVPRILLAYSDSMIDSLNLSDISELLIGNDSDPDALKQAYFNICPTATYLDFAKNELKEIRNRYRELMDIQSSIDEAELHKERLLHEYLEKLSSPEYIDAERKFIEEINAISAKSDNTIPAEMKKEIEVTRKAHTLEFLFDRLEKYGQQEARLISYTYFDKVKGSYCMDRYKKALNMLQVTPSIYRNFINIEEKIAPETYAPLNNLFLFHVIRTIAYYNMSDNTERRYAVSILSMLTKFVENKISDDQLRTLRAAIIKFYEYYSDEETLSYFKENNTLYKNHPVRIEMDTKDKDVRDQRTIDMIKNELGPSYSDDILNGRTPDDIMAEIVSKRMDLTNKISDLAKDNGIVSVMGTLRTFHEVQEYYNNLVQIIEKRKEDDNNGKESEECTVDDEYTTDSGDSQDIVNDTE